MKKQKTTQLEQARDACQAFEMYFAALNSEAHPKIIETLRLRAQALNHRAITQHAVQLITERYLHH